MGLIQRIVLTVFPRSKAEAIEAESRAWMMRCDTCGAERSVWDMGGVRWKASGSSRIRTRCKPCGRVEWHTLYYSGETPAR